MSTKPGQGQLNQAPLCGWQFKLHHYRENRRLYKQLFKLNAEFRA